MVKQLESGNNYLIGVISDTHGRMPSGVATAFKHVDLIIHAGDIGDETVLDRLSKIALVVPVRGNMDYGRWTRRLPETEIIEIGTSVLVVRHMANSLDAGPLRGGFKAVINGHTHRPDVYRKNGVTFINPGSAAFPKFGQPATVALIQIKEDRLSVELIRLEE